MEENTEDPKKLDEIVNTILKHLAFLQHYPPESASTRGNFLFATMLYVALQPALAVYANWQHWSFNSRVSAIDNLLFSMGALCLSIDVYILSEKLRTLVSLTNSKYKLYRINSRTGDFTVEKDSEANNLGEKVELVREITHLEGSRSRMTTNSYSNNSRTKYFSGEKDSEAFILGEKVENVREITLEGYKRTGVSANVNNFHTKTNDFFDKKQELVREITLEGSRRARVTANVLTSFFISFTLIPLSGFVSYFLQLQSIDNLPLPFLIYSPFSFTLNITSFFEYFLLTLVELFYIYYTAVLATTVHVLQVLSINNLLGEMKLFYLNAQEIDVEFENVLNGAQKEANLRLAARELVIHHQTIFRKVRQLNHGSNFRIFYANSYICLQIVFGIFIFLKGEFIYKIKYGLMVVTITLLEYIFSENGQRLQDEGEELRMALYECKWIDKPTWFTKVLQILMIRNNNLPKVGLLNLFTLNRNNVTVVIRGAYSYFSLLNKIST